MSFVFSKYVKNITLYIYIYIKKSNFKQHIVSRAENSVFIFFEILNVQNFI